MRALKSFLAILLFYSLSSAVTVDDFASSAIKQGETFSIESVYVNSSSYAYLVSVNETLSFILLGEGESFKFASEKENIKEILEKYYASNEITYEQMKTNESERQNLLELGKKFNDSRQPTEAECNRYIGTDSFPCDDRDSCLKSCYTPVSHNNCLGIGWPFVDAIILFQNDTRNMSKAYENYTANLQAFNENDLNDSAIQGAIADIRRMRSSAVSLWYNPLFDKYKYNFCHKAYHDFTAIRAAENNLTLIRTRLLPFIQSTETSELLAANALERAQIQEQNNAKTNCVELKKNVFVARMQLSNSINALEREHTDLNSKLNALANLGRTIENDCEQNYSKANASSKQFFNNAKQLEQQYDEALALETDVETLKQQCFNLCPNEESLQRLNQIDALSKTDAKQLAELKNELANMSNSLKQKGGCNTLKTTLPCASALLPAILLLFLFCTATITRKKIK